MAVASKDLWSLTEGNPQIDAAELAVAVEKQVVDRDLDYRSRLLIRDSVAALRRFWGEDKISEWLKSIDVGPEIEAICRGPWDDDRGFSSLMRRVVDVTKAETIIQFLRELSTHVHQPTRLKIGGSAALILRQLLSRKTDDVDFVDEVPEPIRVQHRLLMNWRIATGYLPPIFSNIFCPGTGLIAFNTSTRTDVLPFTWLTLMM
jgi:hypothetical protein